MVVGAAQMSSTSIKVDLVPERESTPTGHSRSLCLSSLQMAAYRPSITTSARAAKRSTSTPAIRTTSSGWGWVFLGSSWPWASGEPGMVGCHGLTGSLDVTGLATSGARKWPSPTSDSIICKQRVSCWKFEQDSSACTYVAVCCVCSDVSELSRCVLAVAVFLKHALLDRIIGGVVSESPLSLLVYRVQP